MDGIEMGVVEGLRVQDIDFLWIVLRPSGVQVEIDLGMGTPVRFLKTRVRGVKGIVLGLCCVIWERQRKKEKGQCQVVVKFLDSSFIIINSHQL